MLYKRFQNLACDELTRNGLSYFSSRPQITNNLVSLMGDIKTAIASTFGLREREIKFYFGDMSLDDFLAENIDL